MPNTRNILTMDTRALKCLRDRAKWRRSIMRNARCHVFISPMYTLCDKWYAQGDKVQHGDKYCTICTARLELMDSRIKGKVDNEVS